MRIPPGLRDWHVYTLAFFIFLTFALAFMFCVPAMARFLLTL